MHFRKPINDQLGSPFVVEVGGDRFEFTDCFTFAEIGNPFAGITEVVLKTRTKRYLHVTTVAADEGTHAYGILQGWYVMHEVDKAMALKIRESWAVLREQPEDPLGGPWAG